MASREYNKEYYESNKEKWSKYRDNKIKNYPVYLLCSSRHRAKKRNIEFSLTVEDIVIPERCPILDIPLIIGLGKNIPRGYNFNSPSVDRIDPLKGYTKDNIQIISFRANHLKSNATLEEIEKLYKFLKKRSRRRR